MIRFVSSGLFSMLLTLTAATSRLSETEQPRMLPQPAAIKNSIGTYLDLQASISQMTWKDNEMEIVYLLTWLDLDAKELFFLRPFLTLHFEFLDAKGDRINLGMCGLETSELILLPRSFMQRSEKWTSFTLRFKPPNWAARISLHLGLLGTPPVAIPRRS